MSQTSITFSPIFSAVIVALALLGAAVVWLGRAGLALGVLVATVRSVVQLGAVALVIAAVVDHLWLTIIFIMMMFGCASFTAARRVTRHPSGGWAAGAIAVSVLPVLGLLIGSGVVPPFGIAVIPISGILIGGAMTATSLAGRRAVEELRSRRGEYEAGIALGLTSRDAALEVCRESAAGTLNPALDRTRTIGLVTLPGAFVGLLLSGVDPIAAAIAQVVVMVSILPVESMATVVAVELVAASVIKRTDC